MRGEAGPASCAQFYGYGSRIPASCLGLHAKTQQVGLQVDAALVAAQHVEAEEEVWTLLHDGDAHGQVLGAYLGVYLLKTAQCCAAYKIRSCSPFYARRIAR